MESGVANWLDEMLGANAVFQERIDLDKLPIERTPSPYAVITCMDPRMNLECIGVSSFSTAGQAQSHVRVIRTIGAMGDNRSIKIGVFLAGIKEIAVVMHTDCGCCLAFSRIDTIIDNMEQNLDRQQFETVRKNIGEPFRENLIRTLKAFQDPRDAVRQEVEEMKRQPFAPHDLIVHGIVYELATGAIDVVVNGYD